MPDQAESTLLAECRDRVLTLTLNRPERLNAIDEPLAQALSDALRGAHRDPAVGCVVIRGRGRAFCAGRDVKTPATPRVLTLVQAVATAIVENAKPVVFAVHGWVVGAGLEWMLAGDIALAARSARFRLPEIELGVFPTGGVTVTLPRVAGLVRAKGMLLLGEPFPAQEAERFGLVWRLVDDDQLDAETERIARRLAGFDPQAVSRFKSVLNRLGADRFAAGIAAETQMQTELMRRR